MTAGIRINGDDYTLDGIQHVPMGDLFVLKSFTHDKGCGVSLKTINAMFDQLAVKAADSGFNPIDLLDDNVFLANMIGLVYLVRRSAGDQIKVQEAWDTPFDEIEFIDAAEAGEGDAPKGETLEPESTVN